jgi:hypothetical protein
MSKLVSELTSTWKNQRNARRRSIRKNKNCRHEHGMAPATLLPGYVHRSRAGEDAAHGRRGIGSNIRSNV